MTFNVLLLGRKRAVLDHLSDNIAHNNLETKIYKATSHDDLVRNLAHHSIDTVIISSNIDIAERLEMVNTIFMVSEKTTVHLNSHHSGPTGMLHFADQIIQNQRQAQIG